jgi:hypothetical protein
VADKIQKAMESAGDQERQLMAVHATLKKSANAPIASALGLAEAFEFKSNRQGRYRLFECCRQNCQQSCMFAMTNPQFIGIPEDCVYGNYQNPASCRCWVPSQTSLQRIIIQFGQVPGASQGFKETVEGSFQAATIDS